MSAQPPQQQQPQQQVPPSPEGQDEQRWNELLDQILGGELPGEGYLFDNAPEQRNRTQITTTPDEARAALLRAVEVCAKNAALPYGMVPKELLAKAALAFSQAYLLLDPSVDEAGVPVGAGAEAQGEAQVAAANAQAQGQQALSAQNHAQQLAQQEQKHAHDLALETHRASLQPTDPESFKRPPATGGHQEPPRVQPNAAELKVEAENKPKADVLKGARGDRPLPRPRVGQ